MEKNGMISDDTPPEEDLPVKQAAASPAAREQHVTKRLSDKAAESVDKGPRRG